MYLVDLHHQETNHGSPSRSLVKLHHRSHPRRLVPPLRRGLWQSPSLPWAPTQGPPLPSPRSTTTTSPHHHRRLSPIPTPLHHPPPPRRKNHTSWHTPRSCALKGASTSHTPFITMTTLQLPKVALIAGRWAPSLKNQAKRTKGSGNTVSNKIRLSGSAWITGKAGKKKI
jgi:hypothetical protein